jgi:hypothetical protein
MNLIGWKDQKAIAGGLWRATVDLMLEYFFPGNANTIFSENDFIPDDFVLHQNYPNPFNPNTKIRWKSAVSGWQTLKVYDVLGNEVAVLFDEYKSAGVYEVEFSAKGGSASGVNAYDLPSGTYFYQLIAGNNVETKKMILLK